MNPNAVGHPLFAIPPMSESVNLKVTGFAIKKNRRAEYKENFAFNPAERAIYSQPAKNIHMWIVFREDKSEFINPDKYVVAVVNDSDILAYQASLGGYQFPLNTDVYFMQEFVRDDKGLLYHARRYEVFRLD